MYPRRSHGKRAVLSSMLHLFRFKPVLDGGLILKMSLFRFFINSMEKATSRRSLGGFASDGEEELELGGELVFSVKAIREVDSSDAAVGMDLHSKKSQILIQIIQNKRSYIFNAPFS